MLLLLSFVLSKPATSRDDISAPGSYSSQLMPRPPQLAAHQPLHHDFHSTVSQAAEYVIVNKNYQLLIHLHSPVSRSSPSETPSWPLPVHFLKSSSPSNQVPWPSSIFCSLSSRPKNRPTIAGTPHRVSLVVSRGDLKERQGWRRRRVHGE